MEEYKYIYISRRKGEVPAKRGRGIGRVISSSSSSDDGPQSGDSSSSSSGDSHSRKSSSQTDQRITSSGRRRKATASSRANTYELEKHLYPIEIFRDDVSSICPSTSSTSKDEYEEGSNQNPIDVEFEEESTNLSLLPKRPGVGSKGRYIRVVSNCFPIKFPSGYVYHYNVEVIDTNQHRVSKLDNKKYRCLNTKKNREVVEFMLKHNPIFEEIYGAFDGQKNLLTMKKLEIELPFTCSVMLPCDRRGHLNDFGEQEYDRYETKIISLVSRINMESINDFYRRKSNDLPQDAIMAIETILRHDPCLNLSPVGRSFFYPSDIGNVTPFGGGLEIWFGYHQSVRFSQWQPTVNLDVSATTFWKEGPVLDFIADYLHVSIKDLKTIRHIRRIYVQRLSKKLKRKQVKVTHLHYGRKYRIVRFREIAANEEYIELTGRDGKSMRKTVAQYFYDTYRKKLEYGNIPCLQVQPETKNIFLPVEVCEFVQGQHYKGELTVEQRSKMIQFTSNPPHRRFEKIQVETANFQRSKTVKGFGLKISDRPLKADARVLNPPSLIYKDRYDSNKSVIPRDGSWNVRETQFYRGAEISSWVLVSFEDDRNLDALVDVLVRTGRNLGMQIRQPSEIAIVRNVDCDKRKLFQKLKDKGNDLAVVVIPTCDETEVKRIYAEIKKAAETEIGLVTQCLRAERLRDMADKRGTQIASNLCLKINAKLRGENHSLVKDDIPTILCQPVIIIGADVNHPAPTQLNQPSIAACVGSLDSIGKRFAVSIRAQVNSSEQKKKVEEICDLEDMVCELLIAFYRHVRHKPRKIIFYRDGVSEGELVTVKNKEVVSIRKACLRLQEDYTPGITTIVVQKRHHVRFRPDNKKEGVGRMNNIPPGTVIDTEVTHPVNFDFFLCSQFGAQGTSRPSHYLVVEDDNNLSADDLQKLTFYLCHMYVRCTKSISIPAPVAYADLVAYRARKHLECKKREHSSSRSDCHRSYRLTQEDIDAIKVVDALKDTMYFV